MSVLRSQKAPAQSAAFELHLVGVNHLTAPVAVREALSYSELEAARWVALAVERNAVDLPGYSIREAAVLSTCNRTECYLVLASSAPGDAHGRGGSRLEARLARLLCGTRPDLQQEHHGAFYFREGEPAARHLLRVAAGLDSMVQGEAQILGQVHRAEEVAREAGGIGPILDRLFASAFRAGKRSRSETEIGRGAVSVASAAVELAVKVVGSLEKRKVLVLGAGETGRLVAQHLAHACPAELWIVNRTLSRAQTLAAEVGGTAAGLDDLARAMEQTDVVVAATQAESPLVTRSMVQSVMRRRRHSTVFIDISVPRNIEQAVHELDGAFVYDMDALQKIVRDNTLRREAEVPRVEAILAEETEQFLRWLNSLSAGPVIALLRDHFEEIRREEVQRHGRALGPKEMESVERITKAVMNKFLHGPTIELRRGETSDPHALDLVLRLFGLDQAAGANPGDVARAPGDLARAEGEEGADLSHTQTGAGTPERPSEALSRKDAESS